MRCQYRHKGVRNIQELPDEQGRKNSHYDVANFATK